MNEYDVQHRITRLDPDDPESQRPFTNAHDGSTWMGHGGHAVCMHPGCGKDMPRCWDVICKTCMRPYCYAHAVVVGGYWICLTCLPSGTTYRRAGEYGERTS
jgi:hypothetical protein